MRHPVFLFQALRPFKFTWCRESIALKLTKWWPLIHQGLLLAKGAVNQLSTQNVMNKGILFLWKSHILKGIFNGSATLLMLCWHFISRRHDRACNPLKEVRGILADQGDHMRGPYAFWIVLSEAQPNRLSWQILISQYTNNQDLVDQSFQSRPTVIWKCLFQIICHVRYWSSGERRQGWSDFYYLQVHWVLMMLMSRQILKNHGT